MVRVFTRTGKMMPTTSNTFLTSENKEPPLLNSSRISAASSSLIEPHAAAPSLIKNPLIEPIP